MFEELREWKRLLDEGIISPEEFEEKKKRILILDDSDSQVGLDKCKDNGFSVEDKSAENENGNEVPEQTPGSEEPPSTLEDSSPDASTGDSPVHPLNDSLTKNEHKNKARENKKRKLPIAIGVAVVVVIAFMGFVLSGPAPEKPTAQGVDCVKEIFTQGSISKLKKDMPIEPKENSDNYELEYPFYSTDGTYTICQTKDGLVDRVIFRWDGDVDSDDIIDDIESVLGYRTSYDYEYAKSEWDTPWLTVSFYADDGIWFDLKGAVPTCDQDGHDASQYGDWDTDYDELEKTRDVVCSKCGYVVDVEAEPITTFVNNAVFSLYPAKFAKRFDEKSDSGIKGYTFHSKAEESGGGFYSKDNILYYRIENEEDNYSDVGVCQFVSKDGTRIPYSEDYTEDNVAEIQILIGKTFDVSAVVFATVMAIDPGLEYSECVDTGQDIVDNVGKKKGVEKNSIRYSLVKKGAYHYLIVKAA